MAANRATTRAFTLVELLVVLGLLSMMAGVILPSAASFIRRDRLEQFVFDVAMLLRETFEQSIYEGCIHEIQLDEDGQLQVSRIDNATSTPQLSFLLRPVKVPAGCSFDWPAEGWRTMPEGFCETPLLRFIDDESGESRIMRVRAYDASLQKESGQYAGAAGVNAYAP